MFPKLVVVACLLTLVGACVPPEESNDRIKRYDPDENIMGQIQARGTMRIGIPSDRPPFAIVEPGLEPRGFLVDLGTLAAESLGVEPEFVPAPNAGLLDLVDGWSPATDEEPSTCIIATDEADIVFPMVPITEKLINRYTFTDPYWVGHTRELLENGVAIDRGPDVDLLAAAYDDRSLRVGGEQQSTEGYGAASRCGTTTFGSVISQVINEADAEGDWRAFYETWVADLFADPAPDEVPIMTVEDAAALYPAELD